MSLPTFKRSTTNKKIAGLFGGLGESIQVDPTYLRLGFIVLGLVTGVIPALLAYALAWAITVEDRTGVGSRDTMEDNKTKTFE